MEFLEKYEMEGDCLSKAMAEMLLKSLNKEISDFRVSPSFARIRAYKEQSAHDKDFLKKTAADSILKTRTEVSTNAVKSFSKNVFDQT